MLKKISLIFLFLSSAILVNAQITQRIGNDPNFGRDTTSQVRTRGDVSVDSLRKQLDNKKDSVIYSAKFIKYTKEAFLQDSTRLFNLDTAVRNYHHFNPLNDPKSPTMNLGTLGLSARPMLFEPTKKIGVDLGYHFFDRYILKPEDIKYYQARSQFTELSYTTPFGGKQEQLFHVLHTQNIKPNWNMGAYYGKIGSEGFYNGQDAKVLNASLWSWYESPNKRYTMLATAIFNTLKVEESGAIRNDSVFTAETIVDPIYEPVRLQEAKHHVRNNTLKVTQFFNVGKQRKVNELDEKVLPTQRFSHTIAYNRQRYFFNNLGRDTTGILNNYYISQDSTADSTILNHLKNEFNYSFYLRNKNKLAFLKNELKVNVGLVHDYYKFHQYKDDRNFQNISLKGQLTYGLSDKVNLNFNALQVVQGRDFGNFLYEAQSEIKLSKSVGKLLLGAYSQNQSPALIFDKMTTNHYRWDNNFENIKTQNVNFAYVNDKFNVLAKAEYFLVSNHLYFSSLNNDLIPAQLSNNINLLKFTLGKDFHFGKFTLENYIVYQKTDYESVLRTPELYNFHSFYMHQDFFKVLKMDFGFDVKYFSKYTANSYAPAIGQFYNKTDIQFDTYPIVDVWARANWKRANLFIRYDYANKGLFSKGYYTVDKYPMPYSLLKFGLSWNFYD